MQLTKAPSLCTIATGLLLTTNLAQALPEDNQQPIAVQADRAEHSSKQNKATTRYIGNVSMQQGSLVIRGDKVTILSENRAVSEIIATGSPAQFTQQPAADQPAVLAKAETIHYRLSRDSISLLEQASLSQGESFVTGNHIDYNMLTAEVKAIGSSNKTNDDGAEATSGRVNMILEPQRISPVKDQHADPVSP